MITQFLYSDIHFCIYFLSCLDILVDSFIMTSAILSVPLLLGYLPSVDCPSDHLLLAVEIVIPSNEDHQ